MSAQTNERSPQLSITRQGLTVRLNARTLWTAAAIALACALIILVISRVFDIVVLFFLAVVFAEGIRPLVNWMHRGKLPRPLAISIVYLVLIAVLGGLGYIMAAPLIAQSTGFINSLPSYAHYVQDLLTRVQHAVRGNPIVGQALNALQSQGSGMAASLVNFLLRLPFTIFNILFSVIFVLTVAFFWVNSIDALTPFVVGLMPSQARGTARHAIDETAHRLSWYVRGLLVNMVFIGITHTIGMLILGVPYPLLLGVFAGLTEAIPIAGPFIAGAVSMAVALIAIGPVKCLEVFVLVVLIQQFEGNVLVPNVMNRVVKLHPLTVLVAVVLGAKLYGILGAVVAVPVAVILHILIVDVLAPLARRANTPAIAPAHSDGTASDEALTGDSVAAP